jgi:hypothetical protein
MQAGSRTLRAAARDLPPALRGYRTEQRQLNVAAGILATAVLGDSAIEHYRGSFRNPMMFAALGTAALALLANSDGFRRRPMLAPGTRRACHALAVGVGVLGTGFHLYNLARRPGRLNLNDLFYGAPIGAPAALILAGALGIAAEKLGVTPLWSRPRVFGASAGRALAATTAFGLGGTVGEVALLHFRGAFQNPFMYVPVSLPPVAAGLMAKAALAPRPGSHRLTRFWLKATAIVGLVGAGFHAYGISRAMDGWRNWRQNLVAGPPIPAPPAFSGLAIAGLAALRLLERDAE